MATTFDQKIIKNAVDKVFKELAGIEADKDGKTDTLSVAELYAAILLVYNIVNKNSPGTHINPPKKSKVLQKFKEFDTNKDGVLDRAEFERFVRPFLKNITYKVIGNVIVFCAVVPTAVFLTRAAFLLHHKTEKFGKKLPGALLACIWSTIFKATGIFN